MSPRMRMVMFADVGDDVVAAAVKLMPLVSARGSALQVKMINQLFDTITASSNFTSHSFTPEKTVRTAIARVLLVAPCSHLLHSSPTSYSKCPRRDNKLHSVSRLHLACSTSAQASLSLCKNLP
jgi:hypothetical protein